MTEQEDNSWVNAVGSGSSGMGPAITSRHVRIRTLDETGVEITPDTRADERAKGDDRLFRYKDQERPPLPLGYSAVLFPHLKRPSSMYNETELEAEANEFFARLNEQGARIVGEHTVRVRETGMTDRTLYIVERRPLQPSPSE